MTPGDAESPQGLELDPHSLLVFNLSRSTDGAGSTDPDGAPSAKCELSLRHSGTSAQHLAFKIMTTQPRRYVVRPNQGVLVPGQSESVAILLLGRDGNSLLDAFNQKGQAWLDGCKDKFLVQSCAVPEIFAESYAMEKLMAKERAETSGGDNPEGWVFEMDKGTTDELIHIVRMAANDESAMVHNRKLGVRHVVIEQEDRHDGPAPVEIMSSESKSREIVQLRKENERLYALLEANGVIDKNGPETEMKASKPLWGFCCARGASENVKKGPVVMTFGE